MDTASNDHISLRNVPLKNIIETLSATVLTGYESDLVLSGRVLIAAMTPEEIQSILNKGDIVITGNIKDSQIAALNCGAKCLIITNNGSVDSDILSIAEKNNCVVMTTPGDTFATARLIFLSAPISKSMTTDVVSFKIDDFVDDIKDRMLQTRYRSYPVLDVKNRFRGFVSRYHLIRQRKKKIILVDHNERSQTVSGIEQANLLEIIDHHRIGDIQTGMPVFFINEPVGSTATIIANLFRKNEIELKSSIAGILCAAVISDTLHFKSPTCTPIDINTAKWLAEKAKINIDEFSSAMFHEGTSLKGKTPQQILTQDFKEYQLSKVRIGIGQVNALDLSFLENMESSLLEYMNKLCEDRRLQIVMLMVTDIVEGGSHLLFTGHEAGFVRIAFNIPDDKYSFFLPKLISRKKQIVPKLSTVISQG
jgi:manganese-dependent inorganic pyrophosphatase